MSAPERKTLVLYRVANLTSPEQGVIATLSAPKVVICSQYADLRDDMDNLIATISWTSDVYVKRN